MDTPVILVLVGAIVGVLTTVGVYPYILKRRTDKMIAEANKMVAQCEAQFGDPTSNYLALLAYEVMSAYQSETGTRLNI